MRGWIAWGGLVGLALVGACSQATPARRGADAPVATVVAVADAAAPEGTDSGAPAVDAGVAAGDSGTEARARAEARLDAAARRGMDASHRAGVAIAVVKRGAVVFSRGYGFADLEARTPVTPDTLFMVASVSKTVVATALMQLVEQGRVDIDGDISAFLPFALKNPHWPAARITPRMVLTHTSSVVNNYEKLAYSFVPEPGAPLPTLRSVLEGFVVPGGAYYDAEKNFLASAPGSTYEYSGLASSFSALVVESVGRTSFEAYCREHVFRPLAMARSAWHDAEVPRALLALPYTWNETLGENEPIAPYELSAYPAATLRTSATELARFLLAFMNDGELDGVRVLRRETVREMQRVQLPDAVEPGQGLIWYFKTRKGIRLLGHSGHFDGYRSEMFFRPDEGVGVVLLSNGDNDEPSDPLLALEDEVFAVASDL